MLHPCHPHPLPSLGPRPQPTLGDQIDSLGRGARKHQLIGAWCPDESSDRRASLFVYGGRTLRERIESAVNRPDTGLGKMRHCVDDGTRLLGCGRVVEIVQMRPAARPIERGKVDAAARGAGSRAPGATASGSRSTQCNWRRRQAPDAWIRGHPCAGSR